MFKVIGTNTYLREIGKWPKNYQEALSKIPEKLAENPCIGYPLGCNFLREKRIKEKRIYYLVYENLNLVLLIAASGKKNQQATIDHIKDHLEEFKEIAKEIIKQVS